MREVGEISYFMVVDPPRGRPVGGGGVHRNREFEQISILKKKDFQSFWSELRFLMISARPFFF
jgi:hypothetical protein